MRQTAQLMKLYGQLCPVSRLGVFHRSADIAEGGEALTAPRCELSHHLGVDSLHASRSNFWLATCIPHERPQIGNFAVFLRALDCIFRFSQIHDDVEVGDILMPVAALIAFMALLFSVERSGFVELKPRCRRGFAQSAPDLAISIVEYDCCPSARLQDARDRSR